MLSRASKTTPPFIVKKNKQIDGINCHAQGMDIGYGDDCLFLMN